MIQNGQVGCQEEGELRNAEVVDAGVREALQPAYRVVADVTDQAGAEGR
jgi:hypothetical protein